MGRKPLGKTPMAPTQYQQRWRTKQRRAAIGAIKRQRRAERLAAMALRTEEARLRLDTMPAIYNLIVIDPPWPFTVRSHLTGLDRSHENHYQAMTLSDIEALGPKIPAAPDCVLALWATVPHMANAYRILTIWGFDYVTTVTWNKRTKDMAKPKRGLGYVTRNVTKHLIIGKRGNPPWAIPGEQWDSAFAAPVRGHSVKLDEPYAFVAKIFSGVFKLEMFARCARDGWTAWGNEAPVTQAA